MKTLTITLHRTDNCGSTLQAYALQHFLNSHGVDNEIIDYVPGYLESKGNLIKSFLRFLIYGKYIRARKKKFNIFIDENLKVTKRKYKTYLQLKLNYPKADCYITGSDQLWNTMYMCGRDPAYYLSFANARKIAYGVSVARCPIPIDNLEIICRHANNFEWISTREKSSVMQLTELEISDKEIEHVCDPVLLNPVCVYDKVKTECLIKEMYILVYLAQDIDIKLLYNLIKKININNYKVVFAGAYRNKIKCDYHIRDMGPAEFISLIYNAEYVVSNSYHATIFSLLYKKQFATVLPPQNNSRIMDILEWVR